MVSQRQLEANRANAKRSTGPKSTSGKARSRLNAVTHGLTARQLVVGAEKPEDFDALREALFADLEPSGALQCELVDEIARIHVAATTDSRVGSRLAQPPHDPSRRFVEPERGRTRPVRDSLPEAHSQPARRRLSVAVDDEGSDGKPERMPRRIETLSILSRIEASLLAGRSRTLSLLLGLKAARAAAEADARTVRASPANGRLPPPQ